MTQDQVQQEITERGGEVWYLANLFIDHANTDHDVAEELAFVCISNATGKRKLSDFAEVVKQNARQQKIEVDVRIMRRSKTRNLTHREYVLDEAANPIVVHRFRSRRRTVRSGDGFIRED